MYDAYVKQCDAVYIGFSGGKDSVVLLDLCHKVLPQDVPVVFSDTDMELPDSYRIWDEVPKRYPERPFLKVRATQSAVHNWRIFGPPSQALRWCCSVHKSSPAILALKERIGKKSIRTMAFVGVRSEESLRRSEYDDIGEGIKSHSQVNAMPIIEWSAHEIWLYIFDNSLLVNDAYRKGLPRVGCLMCPMASDRQNELIRMSYPDSVKPFAEVVKAMIEREFSTTQDADVFVFEGGWYARKSGVSLRDVIPEPSVTRTRDRIVFEFSSKAEPQLREWLKAIEDISGAEIHVTNGALECAWVNGKVDKAIAKWLAYAVHKAVACVGCGVCEAECPTGALHFAQDKVQIDEGKCIHCMRCFSADDGCCRYYSKRYAGGRTMNISGINKYMTFGLRPEWISILVREGSAFRQTSALGTRMIPAAVTWFREAGLIADTTDISSTVLLTASEKLGGSDTLLWQLIWLRLANTSPLVKWYVCDTDLGIEMTLQRLDTQLTVRVASPSVRKGALQSLCQLIKNSPIGGGDGAWIETKAKGRSIESLKRRIHEVEPLVTLYGLYVVAEKAGRGTFTVRQLMEKPNAEGEGFSDVFVSPMVVFGLSPDAFKKHCLGLATQYPELVACSFTLGLDEVRVFPETKTRDDVLAAIMKGA
jgi:3'-phosphoadenosine 5'-phosphosulfate sulfotransferase (PAPS reductase)/FAD synthetase